MRQVPLSPLSFDPQRVANVPEHPPPSTRLRSCAHIANRRLSRIIGARIRQPNQVQPTDGVFHLCERCSEHLPLIEGSWKCAWQNISVKAHTRAAGDVVFVSGWIGSAERH